MMLNPFELESFSRVEDDKSVRTMSSLWDDSEQSTRAKLLLPHSFQPAFYLPSPRMKKQSQADQEREQRRFQFLAFRDVRTSKTTATKISLPAPPKKNAREIEIEHRLFDKYRNNDHLKDLLFERAKEIEDKKKQKRLDDKERIRKRNLQTAEHLGVKLKLSEATPGDAPQSKVSVPMALLKSLPPTEVDTVTALDPQVSARSSMSPRRNVRSSPTRELSAKALNELRRKVFWLVLVTGLSQFQAIAKPVLEARQLDKHQMKFFRAVMTIRFYLRKWVITRRNKGALVDLHASKADARLALLRARLKDSSAASILQERVESCQILVAFIRDVSKTFRIKVNFLFRKIRLIQRCLRAHMAVNAARVIALNKLMDRSLPHIVAALGRAMGKKGPASRPPTLDPWGGRKVGTTNKLVDPHVVEIVKSDQFQAFLLSRYDEAKSLSKHFPMHAIEDLDKSRLLETFLFRSRRRHLANHIYSLVQISARNVTEEEVRGFIEGGRDPLVDIVQEMSDTWFARRAIIKHGGRLLKTPKFLLYSSISAEAWGELLIDVTSEARRASRERGHAKAHFADVRRGSAHGNGAGVGAGLLSSLSEKNERDIHLNHPHHDHNQHHDPHRLTQHHDVHHNQHHDQHHGQHHDDHHHHHGNQPMKSADEVHGVGSIEAEANALRPASPPRTPNSTQSVRQRIGKLKTTVV